MCGTSIVEGRPLVLSTGAAGTLIAWGDGGGGVNVQRLDAAGAPLLGAGGVAVAGFFQYDQIVSDGAGGLIGVFMRGQTDAFDLYAQRVDGSGTPLWGADGHLVASAPFDQRPSDVIPDGAGGAYVTWYDLRNGSDWDVYAQHLNASGTAVAGWPANGLDLTPLPGFQIYPRIVADGAQGCIVSWYDARNATNGYDIYAQRLTSDGTIAAGWASGGIAVCSAAGDQSYPILASDGAGGALVAWQDWRVDGDVYAQHVGFNGSLGDSALLGVDPAPRADFAIGAVFPNPSRSSALRVSLALPNGAPARLAMIDAQGRLIARQVVQLAGGGRATVALDASRSLPPGVYLLRLDQFGRTTSRTVSIVR